MAIVKPTALCLSNRQEFQHEACENVENDWAIKITLVLERMHKWRVDLL